MVGLLVFANVFFVLYCTCLHMGFRFDEVCLAGLTLGSDGGEMRFLQLVNALHLIYVYTTSPSFVYSLLACDLGRSWRGTHRPVSHLQSVRGRHD